MEYAEIVKIFDRKEYAAFVKIMVREQRSRARLNQGIPAFSQALTQAFAQFTCPLYHLLSPTNGQ